jgi:Caspase domain
MARRAIRLLIVLIFVIGVGADAAAADRVALVIGNAAYPTAPLKNPINDARAMAEKLSSVGFEVIKLENATLAKMNKAVVELTERLGNEGAAVFYFAGHGMQLRGKNFLLAVDTVTNSEASVRNTAYDFDQLMDSLGESRRTNIIILDACRNNPFSNARGGSRGLAQANAPYGTLISYATSPGLTAADGDGENGLFTWALLRYLGEPDTIEEVFKKVRVDVATASKGEQVPWESSSLVGRFSFVDRDAEPDLRSAAAIDLEYWRAIQGSKNRADYESYLARFPDGQFAEIARSRIAALNVPAPPPEPPRVKAPAPASTATPAPAKSHPSVAQDPLCSKIVERISIGEPVPKDDLAYLRTKCKGG